MKDYYKQQIEKVAMEKIAARAWKKVLPKLSDVNYKRLVDAGVYNKNKELQGLRRGTHNILQKYDAKMIRKPNKAGAATVELESKKRELSPITKRNLKQAPGEEMLAATRFNSNGNKPIKAANNKTGGVIFTPKNTHNKSYYTDPEGWDKFQPGFKPFSRRDRDGRKWSQAITERHEADEIRYGHANQKKGIGEKAGYSSHISPKVTMQESANIGLMPRSVKNRGIADIRQGSGEASFLGQISGVPYGSSAVYNKGAARKAEKNVLKQNMNGQF